MYCMLLCGCRRLNYGTKCTETVFLSVWVLIELICYTGCFVCCAKSLCKILCPNGAFQWKHGWKLNRNSLPSDLFIFSDVEKAIFHYGCLKPSSVANILSTSTDKAELCHKILDQWRKTPGKPKEAIFSPETIGSFCRGCLIRRCAVNPKRLFGRLCLSTLKFFNHL